MKNAKNKAHLTLKFLFVSVGSQWHLKSCQRWYASIVCPKIFIILAHRLNNKFKLRKSLANKAGKKTRQAWSTQTQNSSPLEFCYNHISSIRVNPVWFMVPRHGCYGPSEHQTWEMAVSWSSGRWVLVPSPPPPWPPCPLYGTVGAQLLGHAGSICQWQWGAPQHQHSPSITRPLYTSACPQLQPSDFTQSVNPELSQSDWWESSGDIDGYVCVRKVGNALFG